jgi:type IV secretion system protein VirB10
MTPLPPPVGLPPPQRSIRALRSTPRWIFAGVTVVVVGAVYYGLTHMDHGGSRSAAAPDDNNDSATPDVLASAPPGNEIRQRRPIRPGVTATAFRPVTTQQQEPAPASASSSGSTAALEDDMTEAAIAGRKAAWAGYYQQLNDARQHRLEAARASMASDTVPAGDTAATGVSGVVAGATGGAPANGDKPPQDFFSSHASNPATDYLPYTLTTPISPYELKATDIITAKLVSGMNSDSPGIIKALVTKNVTDHATGMHILVPQGSTLVGVYDTDVAYGQTRMVSAWQRIIYPAPCDQSLDLGAMPGADPTGQAGFADSTDNHLWKIFSSAILVSLFSAGAQLSQPAQSSLSTYSPMQTAAGAVGQQTSQLGAEFARKGLSIPPTQQIRQGYAFAVMTTKDIAFEKPWVEGVCDPIDVDVANP